MKNNHLSEEQFLEKLDEFRLKVDTIDYKFDKEGHIVVLDVCGAEDLHLGYFPEEICKLKFLQELFFTTQKINTVPECLRNLTSLSVLDLSDNKIQEFPPLIANLPNLKEIYVTDKILNLPHRNLLEFIDIADFKDGISLKDVSAMYEEFKKTEQAERDELTRKYNEREEPWKIFYPPDEILRSPQDCKYIILWMLDNNFACMWGDFRDDPINMNQHLVWKYIDTLSHYNLIYKINDAYMITELGRKELRQIESSKTK